MTMAHWHQLDAISTPAAIEGRCGKAWRIEPGKLGLTAAVALWLVEAPAAHPVWHSYLLSLVHLRPLVKATVPVLYLQGATHELVVQALDPDFRREFLISAGNFRALTPANFAAQIIAENDVAAGHRLLASVREICAGILSPDTDFIAEWVARYGDNMMRDRPAAGSA